MLKYRPYYESANIPSVMLILWVMPAMIFYLLFLDWFAPLRSLLLGAVAALPFWLFAPWVCRQVCLDEEGMELRYGRWYSVRYAWSELSYTAKRFGDQNCFEFSVWVKGKERSRLPIHRFSSIGNAGRSSVSFCYALRECFGREPDNGALELTLEERRAIEAFPILSGERLQYNHRMVGRGNRLITVGTLLAAVQFYNMGDPILLFPADILVAVLALICLFGGFYCLVSIGEEERCASFARGMRLWNLGLRGSAGD